jgi:hypothetical protein
MVAGFSRAVDVDRTAEHEAWRILFRRRARSAERKLSQIRARHHTDLSATAPCEATIASAVALDMFRPLRLDFGAEATADRLVERYEVVARDRLRTPILGMVSPGATTFFRTTRRWPQCPASMTGLSVRPVVRGIKRGLA